MNSQRKSHRGLSLVELLVAMALSVTVMGGVVSVLLSSKTNFMTEQELATLQENARYAVKFLGDEIRMAGFSACSREPRFTANVVTGAASSWYLKGLGIEGFEHEAPLSNFPADFRSDVLPFTDALAIRRGNPEGYVVSNHVSGAGNPRVVLNKVHDIEAGQIMVISTPGCQQVGIFQVRNVNAASTNLTHSTNGGANSVSPGNCSKNLSGAFSCASGVGGAAPYPDGSNVMRLSSKAFYIGDSAIGGGVPALYVRSLEQGSGDSTILTELVQGVENMQILYGVDNDDDNFADTYMQADDIASSVTLDWNDVVNVRIALRMRSINPVYMRDEPYPIFQDIVGSDGSDRFMRELISTTIQIRN